MATGKFSSAEWKQLVNAPQLILHVLALADRSTFFSKRSEAKTLEKFLESYHSQSSLVQSIIDGQKEADTKFDASVTEGKAMLQRVGTLLEAKSDDVEGDAVRDFLMSVSQAVAEASREQALGASKPVSAAEQEALDDIAAALKATEADKRRRREAAIAAEAKKRDEAQAAQAKREAEAKRSVEEARERREAEAKKKAEEEAKKKAEEEAQKKAEAEARIKREAEARAEKLEEMRKAQVKKAEEQKAMREAQALKQKAEAAKQEAEAAKQAAEAAKKEAENIYVVKSGDTLSGIAKKVYGKAGRWPEIFEANKDIIENPNLIRPGWKLRIP